MKNDKTINLVYTMDDNFAMQAGVSLVSLFENNRESHFHVYVLSDNISDNNKSKLVQLTQRWGSDIDVIEMPDVETNLGVSFSTYGWVRAAYARLFLCDLLPEDLDRIIYFDPDTIIVGKIDYLFDVLFSEEFDSYYAGACRDSISTFKRLHGFKKKEIYYNSGVMLINLKKWRESGIQKIFIDEVKRRNGKSIDVDQSYINCIMINHILTLPVKYNVMAIYYSGYNDYLHKSGISAKETYTEQEIADAVRNPLIIHFAGDKEYRPWYEGCKHSMKTEWLRYLTMTEWKDYRPVTLPEAVQPSVISIIKTKLIYFAIKNPYLGKLYTYHKYGFWVKLFREGF